MRLIYFLFFLFGLFSNSFVGADSVLDLDFYDSEKVYHSSSLQNNYSVEVFHPNEGKFTDVTALGSSMVRNGDVSKVVCYSVNGLCQLVQLFTDSSDAPSGYFERSTTYFESVESSKFADDLNNLKLGTYKPKLFFLLNLTNKNNPRGLYSVEENVADGVDTNVFTSLFQQNLVSELFCGDDRVFMSLTDHAVKVTASKKGGDFVLLKVDTVNNDVSGTKFYTKDNNVWHPVDLPRYNELLRSLHPEPAVEDLTLDVNAPEDGKYHVKREYDRGLTSVTYSPLPRFHLVNVRAGDEDLWSGKFGRATEVLSVLLSDQVVSVRVTSLLASYKSFHHFNKVDGKFVEATEKEFWDNLEKLRQATEESRAEPEQPTPHTLDLSNPSGDFDVKLSSEQGVTYKRFTPKVGVVVSKVVLGTQNLWDPQAGTTLQYVNVYLNKQGLPSAYMLYAVGPGNKKVVDSKYDVGNNLWWFLHPSQLKDHLKGLRDAPTLDHSLELNLGPDVVLDHTTVDEFSTLGVGTTSYTAEDQYYFSKVTWNGELVFEKTDGTELSPVNVRLFKDAGGDYKLLELGGFLPNGEYKTEYFNWDGSKFAALDSKAKFLKAFDALSGSVVSGAWFSPEESVESGEEAGPSVVVYNLDTSDFDPQRVSHAAGAENGYYFDSYVPKDNFLFGDVKGPGGFSYLHRGARFVTLAKFYSVHGKFLGAVLKTVGSLYRTQELVYYYTFENNKWSYSTDKKHFSEVLASELRYSPERKEEHERLLRAEEDFEKTMGKVRAKEEKERKKELEKLEKEVKREEDEAKKRMLDKKTLLYTHMVDLDKEEPPELEKVELHTPEELEHMQQPYGEEKFVVESELVYYDFKAPKDNTLVHTKDFQSNGLEALDATPVAGKFFHILSLNGRRLWVSTSTRRCTNLQLFFEEGNVVGAVLRVTVSRNGKLKAGEDYDYLFVTDGELKTVDVEEFNKLANVRFQSAALAQLSKL
ncbi:polymorphic antigen precursor-like protein, putative [Theileria annulata]|uniref:Polymorphic antigen-like protein, putative n=1 Tax=Theileria annulata TaxID=5874 RepID=Q4UIH9_THEAN|nr:polymorphic antigen precursor-like protein, putative [Theileria annulata]CAI73110.1 polymorphic antigen precursor-like protein, putative [Theileria annulata]|eukprot:XP_953788.1 polymorphic antigen precursor-like protein, putative [Theileria annulata]